jgi:hypothetical protein
MEMIDDGRQPEAAHIVATHALRAFLVTGNRFTKEYLQKQDFNARGTYPYLIFDLFLRVLLCHALLSRRILCQWWPSEGSWQSDRIQRSKSWTAKQLSSDRPILTCDLTLLPFSAVVVQERSVSLRPRRRLGSIERASYVCHFLLLTLLVTTSCLTCFCPHSIADRQSKKQKRHREVCFAISCR